MTFSRNSIVDHDANPLKLKIENVIRYHLNNTLYKFNLMRIKYYKYIKLIFY
jgi:hypothetical protein